MMYIAPIALWGYACLCVYVWVCACYALACCVLCCAYRIRVLMYLVGPHAAGEPTYCVEGLHADEPVVKSSFRVIQINNKAQTGSTIVFQI